MDFTKILLRKELRDLLYPDIEDYFKVSRKESNTIEFKSYTSSGEIDSQYNAIYKTICGFLNSDGGLLIWGAPSGQKMPGKKEKEFFGELKPIDKSIEKDALINKICSNISPLPQGFRVEILEKEERQLCIIEVDKNRNGPFQTNDIYYMRLDGQTKPAPHYYIEALFRQITYPELGGYIKFSTLKINNSVYYLSFQVIILNHSPLQNEEKISWRLLVDPGSFIKQSNKHVDIDPVNNQMYSDNFPQVLHLGEAPYTDVILTINPYELNSNNNQVHIILLYGGRFSPMKMSQYKVDLKNPYPADINEIIIFKEENNLLSDFGKNDGTEKEKVERILGRMK